jgi:hypothetical protein
MKIRTFLIRVCRRLPLLLLLAAVTGLLIGVVSGKIALPLLRAEDGGSVFDTPLGPSGGDSVPTADDPTDPGAEKIVSDPIVLPKETRPQLASSEEAIVRIGGAVDFTSFAASPNTVPVLRQAGFSLSTEPYSADSAVLSYAGGFDFLPQVRSQLSRGVQHVRYASYGEAAPVAEYYTMIEAIPAVQLYMGRILIENKTHTAVYSSDGEYIYTYLSKEYAPAYTRDRWGNPLFTRDEEVEVTDEETGEVTKETVTRYYTLGTGGFALSDYDDEIEGRGLYFDYPPSFGISDTAVLRFAEFVTKILQYEDGTEETQTGYEWAYGYAGGWRLTGYNFTSAWDYSEGRAAVTDENGHLVYLNESGYQAFYTESSYYYYERFVSDYLLPPLTAGPESIGFLYYDHGYVRVRRQVVDWYALEYMETLRVSRDYDYLVDKNGREFPLPQEYTLVAYSDGVCLLEKDGKYGYMDTTGAWIAQPIYDYAEPFSEGLAVAGFSSGVRLMIDTAGEIVIPPGEYDYISSVSSGVIACWSRFDGWEILHKMAKFS